MPSLLLPRVVTLLTGLLLGAALLSPPARAGGPYTIDHEVETVKGWSIAGNRVRNACFMSTEFEGGLLIGAGFDARQAQKSAYMLFAHSKWRFVTPGTRYRISMVFNGGKRWNGEGVGVKINEVFGVALEDVKTAFVVDFAQKTGVALSIDGREFGRYNLYGTLSGLNATIDCTNGVVEGRIALGAPQQPDKPAAPATATPASGTAPKPEVAETSSGTGFFINDGGHVLTNAHVVAGCAAVTLRLPDGRTGEGTVQARSTQNDLAVIRSDLKPPRFARFRGAPPVRLGDTIVLFGYPLAGALTVTGNLSTGLVSALAGAGEDVTKMQISAPVQSGNSGGAVVDQTGHVVGVVVSKTNVLAGKESLEVLQNVNFAIKAGVAGLFLDAQQVAYTVEPPGEPLATPDVAAQARDFSALVVCSPKR